MSDRTGAHIQLEASWKDRLLEEFSLPYMVELREFLYAEKRAGKVIYPRGDRYFHALNTTAFDDVRVVILGQDPYHGPGQAHGLCFSVPPGVAVPPSLQNIYRELAADLQLSPPGHGCLVPWALQGVLLLNAVLTVEQGRAGSHQGRGWERFTDRVIELLNARDEPLVFLLWGSHAQRKAGFVDTAKHSVLRAPHPSPLSAHRGFFGCRHFSKANAFLQDHGQRAIDWRLPEADEIPAAAI